MPDSKSGVLQGTGGSNPSLSERSFEGAVGGDWEKFMPDMDETTGQATQYSVRIKTIGRTHTIGEVHIQHLTNDKRLFRALQFWIVSWGIAAVSIFIPLAHFVLVPGFLIVGIITPFYIYSAENKVLGGVGTCPACGSPLSIHKSTGKWPLKEICQQCRVDITIEQISSE